MSLKGETLKFDFSIETFFLFFYFIKLSASKKQNALNKLKKSFILDKKFCLLINVRQKVSKSF